MCESANDSDFEENFIPSELMDLGVDVNNALLPGKSKKIYEKSYNNFMSWKTANNMDSFSESVLLSYFQEMAKKFKSSSLWTEYSKLKATLNLHHQINISPYSKLHAFLKHQSQGYKVKKSKTFLPHEIEEFLNKAPDELYLPIKVALIFGILGACRRKELHDLKFKHVKDLNSAILVNISNSSLKNGRTFTVQGKFYGLCKRYMELRPKDCATPNFFIRYSNGLCVSQNVGINTFGKMGTKIARFLNLPNPASYTGHCFRRTSATLSIVASEDAVYLERNHRWKTGEESMDSTTPDASTSRSLREFKQNTDADPDSNHSSIHNDEYDTKTRLLLVSVKAERTDSPHETDPFSDSSVTAYDSDELGSLQDVVEVKTEEVTLDIEEVELEESTATDTVNSFKAEEPTRPENSDTEGKHTGTWPASHTQLLEAILASVSRQERAAERAARAQEAQARALDRIALLLERGRGGNNH